MDFSESVMLMFLSRRMRAIVKSANTKVRSFNINVELRRSSICNIDTRRFRFTHLVLTTRFDSVFKEPLPFHETNLNNEKVLITRRVHLPFQYIYLGFPSNISVSRQTRVEWLLETLIDVFSTDSFCWYFSSHFISPKRLSPLFKLKTFTTSQAWLVFRETLGSKALRSVFNKCSPVSIELDGEINRDFFHPKALKIRIVRYSHAEWLKIEYLLWELESQHVRFDATLLDSRDMNLFLRGWVHKGNDKLRTLYLHLREGVLVDRDILFNGLITARKAKEDTDWYYIATKTDTGRNTEVVRVSYTETTIVFRSHPEVDIEKEKRIIRMLYEKKDIEKELETTETRMELCQLEDESDAKRAYEGALRAEKEHLLSRWHFLNNDIEAEGAKLSIDGIYDI